MVANLLRAQQVHSTGTEHCYERALNRIAFTYWACAHGNNKRFPSLRLWACTIDRIGSGRSDARRTSWTCALQNGADLCVNHGDMLRERRASLSDEERKKEKKEKIAPRGSGRGR